MNLLNRATHRVAASGLLAALFVVGPSAAAFAQSSASCPPAAQPPSAEQIRAGLRDARDHGFLWRVSKDGHSSYLYGTVHVARPEWMYPGPTVAKALATSDTIALELDVLDPEVQQRMAQGSVAGADHATGTTAASALPDALPDALRLRLRRQAEAQCLPPDALARFTPELQVAALMTLVGRRDGLDPAYGIDVFLAGWARGSKKPTLSLETPTLQLNALRMGSPDETREFIESSLDALETDHARPALLRIAQVWADSDLDALARYESWCDCIKTATDRAALKRLLDDRNPALADRIAALHGQGQHLFAAVGSLHMIGPLGLPVLLAQRGFEVEPVLPPP